MTPTELNQETWAFIDERCMNMSQLEYLEFLEEVRDSAEDRAQAVREEIGQIGNDEWVD